MPRTYRPPRHCVRTTATWTTSIRSSWWLPRGYGGHVIEPQDEVLEPGRAAGLLRGLIRQLTRGTVGRVWIGHQGRPEAVLLSMPAYTNLVQRLDDSEAALTALRRASQAPPVGQGLTTEELIAEVAAGDPALAADLEQPGTEGLGE